MLDEPSFVRLIAVRFGLVTPKPNPQLSLASCAKALLEKAKNSITAKKVNSFFMVTPFGYLEFI
ncbi:hypothetical protein ASZ90_005197 [hydrocarbon metagenome]|uniref:Uncharacterized protein n=1 Tax=hydrocarbon metagenome TaxID=938273 RepID=A0A0W8FXJ0_9ZZZZ